MRAFYTLDVCTHNVFTVVNVTGVKTATVVAGGIKWVNLPNLL